MLPASRLTGCWRRRQPDSTTRRTRPPAPSWSWRSPPSRRPGAESQCDPGDAGHQTRAPRCPFCRPSGRPCLPLSCRPVCGQAHSVSTRQIPSVFPQARLARRHLTTHGGRFVVTEGPDLPAGVANDADGTSGPRAYDAVTGGWTVGHSGVPFGTSMTPATIVTVSRVTGETRWTPAATLRFPDGGVSMIGVPEVRYFHSRNPDHGK